MVKTEDYHPFLLFHVGTTEDTTKRLQNIKRDFISLGKMLKGSEAQVVFSSVLSVGDWNPRRRQRMHQVNEYLCNWCHVQGFGFHDLGNSFERLNMLTRDGVHLNKMGKSFLVANLLDSLAVL